jgi:hypothetical protein
VSGGDDLSTYRVGLPEHIADFPAPVDVGQRSGVGHQGRARRLPVDDGHARVPERAQKAVGPQRGQCSLGAIDEEDRGGPPGPAQPRQRVEDAVGIGLFSTE